MVKTFTVFYLKVFFKSDILRLELVHSVDKMPKDECCVRSVFQQQWVIRALLDGTLNNHLTSAGHSTEKKAP